MHLYSIIPRQTTWEILMLNHRDVYVYISCQTTGKYQCQTAVGHSAMRLQSTVKFDGI